MISFEQHDLYKGYSINGTYFSLLGYREDYPRIYFRKVRHVSTYDSLVYNPMGEFYDSEDIFLFIFNLLKSAI